MGGLAAKAEAESEARAAAREWTMPELESFATAMLRFPGGYPNRWGAVRDFQEHNGFPRKEKECVTKAQNLKAVAAGSPFAAGGVDQTSDSGASQARIDHAKPKSSATPAEGSGADAWTADQQKALEAALAKYPASLEKAERWTNIAADVEGRTKKECAERFKWIRAQVIQQKEDAQTKEEKTAERLKELERKEAAAQLEKERLRKATAARKEKAAELARQEQAQKEEERARQEQEHLECEKREKEKLEQKRIQDQEKRETAAKAKSNLDGAVAAQRATRNRSIDKGEIVENRQLQEDEFVVLESVFPDCFKREAAVGACTITIGESTEGVCSVRLQLPESYPSLCPPEVATFSGLPTGCREAALCEELEALFVERVGEVILYDWLVQVQEMLREEYAVKLF